ncbi:ubiquinol-cytochrome-c reductase complex assembly factor 1-like [Mercenaria mercenaria]|uniref:ubiquinol-cytochrome-c reductase complex assembly factor 1-like n=1 Tax=Mercenaria mercenaria TaxID=6596 RepID=UPI00234F6684|nr:ubiquinol-cytochrome-c reductase complex assembly factor 1-like [Mercenaria mercenaria]XP_053382373.1 ubiquinol-cytochrome-c reductase complex assembly factor 1-like [Mercenaria mercenaria]
MNKTCKIVLYRVMKLRGIRLYSSRSWLNITGGNSNILKRSFATHVQDPSDTETGFVDKIKERLGMKGSLRYYPSTLQHSGFRLYLSAVEASRYNRIYDYIDLPDTMATWHKLTSLHIWLLMVRLSTEGRDARLVRNETTENFITDMKAKSKVIGRELKIMVKGDELEMLHQMFLAALMNYDEGLLGTDRHLAGALWRSLFNHKPDIDPSHLEIMVAYIRKQVAYLQKIDSKSILTNGLIPFLPVEGDTIPKSTYEALEKIRLSKLQIQKS